MAAWLTSVWMLCRDGLRGRSRLGIVAIVVVVALAGVGLVAGSFVRAQGPRLVDEVAEEAAVAHSVLYGSTAALQQAGRDNEVSAASGPYPIVAAALADHDDIEVRLAAVEDPAVEVGRPARLEGRWLVPGAAEVVLDRSLALDLGIGLGTRLAVTGPADSVELTVVGTAIDLTDCFYPQCDPGRAWVDDDTVGRLRPPGVDVATMLVRLSDGPGGADGFAARALSQEPAVASSDSWPDTRDDLLGVDRIFGAFLAGFGLFLLAAACVVMVGALTARMVARQREVGLLVAVGVTPGQVMAALIGEHLVLGLVGAILGWFAAGAVTPMLQIGLGDVLPASSHLRPVDLMLAIGVIEVILAAATVIPALRAARVPPTAALRDTPSLHASAATRMVGRFADRHPMVGLGVAEITSRPLRAALSASAVALAVVGSLVAVGFVRTIDAAVADPGRSGDPWDLRVSPPVDPAALTSLPTVATYFTTTERRSTIGDQAFLSRAIGGPVEGAKYQLGAGRLPERAGEAIAGYGFLERYDVAVGDTVGFAAAGTPLEVTIVGWYREAEDAGEILTYRYEQLAQAQPGIQPDALFVVAAPNADIGALAETTSALAGPGSDVATQPGDTGDDLAPFRMSVMIIATLVALVALAQLLSALVTAARERAREVGVLRTLGATGRQIRIRAGMTGAAIGLAAAVVGTPIGMVAYRALSDSATGSIGLGPGWAPDLPAWLILAAGPLGIAASALIGVLSVQPLLRTDAATLVHWE